jgi:hypothetical protein
MRSLGLGRLGLLAALAGSGLVGCGYQIGASCIVDTDCSADGSRTCDISEPDGYCTILGCDYDTCPSDSECVKFYTGQFANKPCTYTTENATTDNCSYDEECSLDNTCVPRAAEQRDCMATCSSSGDCRDGYECRKFNAAETYGADGTGSGSGWAASSMQRDGGEVVLAPGDFNDASTQGFCAPSPTGSTD